mgnify:CR=1 FL=1
MRPQERTGILMILPVLALVGFFTIYPFSYAIYLSFVKYVIFEPQNIGKWIGLKNYAGVLSSYYFSEAVLNTLVFTVLSVVTIVILAIGVSLALNEQFKGVGIVRFLILIPWAIPSASAGLMWRWIFHSYGWVNKILVPLGIIPEAIYFLGRGRLIEVGLIMIAQVWQQLPFCVVILMATLQLVPKELLDSAQVDGANAWQRFRHVTFPFIRIAVLILAAFQAMLAITVYDVIYVFTGGLWGMISYYAYSESFLLGDFGRGAALSITIAFTILIVILIILRILPGQKIYRYSFVEA